MTSLLTQIYFNNQLIDEIEVSSATTTLSTITSTLCQLYEQSKYFDTPEYELRIKYRDEEGDWVDVSSDQEWALCLTMNKEQLQLQIVVLPQRYIEYKVSQAFQHVREIGTSLVNQFILPVSTSGEEMNKYDDSSLIRLTSTTPVDASDDDLVAVDSVLTESVDLIPEHSSNPSTVVEDDPTDEFEMISHSMISSMQNASLVDEEPKQQEEEEPVQQQQQQPVVEESAQKYEHQLQSLRDMGFTNNDARNLQLLEQHEGNLVAVVTSLLSGFNV